MRRNIFISHSSKDIDIAKDISLKLEAKKVPHERIFVSKFAIHAGDEWENVINDALLNSRVVIFLISDHFNVSGYIKTEISRAINQAALDHRLKICWLKISETEPPEDLAQFQGFFAKEALCSLAVSERDRMIEQVASELQDLLGPDGSIRDAFENQLERIVQRNFGLRLRKRLARGDSSIVFLGEGPGFRRVIKATGLTTSDDDQNKLANQLNTQVEKVRRFRSAPFIQCTNGHISDGMQVIISDFVPKCKSLRRCLKTTGNPASIGKVRKALGELAEALAQYHSEGLVYGNLRSKDILVENPSSDNWSVRLQAFSLAGMRQELWESNYNASSDIGWSKIEALAPEQHETLTATQKSDQYSLGLIGIEMLQGIPPVRIRSLKDLRDKEEFFADPAKYGGVWKERSPRLTKILLKMLDPDPAKRYQSMRRVVLALNVKGTFAEDNRKIAKRSYQSLHNRGVWIDVLTSFYRGFLDGNETRRMLFRKAFPEDAVISANSSQIFKLDKAILYLLNFQSDDADEPTTLSAIRERHAAFNLTRQDFNDFEYHLLRALDEAGEGSDEDREAWTTTIKAGLDYMSGCAETSLA